MMTIAKIEVAVGDDESVTLWQQLADVAALLPGEWVLVGGLMVQLHAFEHGAADVRVTRDIDVLAQARPQGALAAIAAALHAQGFEPEGPDLDGYAHRFVRDRLIVDVLAPDGIKPPPTLHGSHKAVGIPGGSQALNQLRRGARLRRRPQFHLTAAHSSGRNPHQGPIAHGSC